MGWKAEIASARSKSDEPLINSAKEIKKLLKSSPKYLVDEVIEEEVARLHKERKPIDAEVFKRISKGENKHLEDVAKEWKIHEEKRGLAQKFIDQMNNDVQLVVKQFPTSNYMTAEHVEWWIKDIARIGKLSASSVTRIIGSGKNFYKYLQSIKEVSVTESNPFVVPAEFKISNKPNSKSVNKTQSWLPFSPKEIVGLYQLALDESQTLADLILIAMHTGARIEEICSLLCKNVDIKQE
jgi:site-specific recombinase XerD